MIQHNEVDFAMAAAVIALEQPQAPRLEVTAREVLGLASAVLGLPVWSVARDTSNPYIARHVQRMRENSGQRTLEKGDTWRQIIRLLFRPRNDHAFTEKRFGIEPLQRFAQSNNLTDNKNRRW